MNKIISSQLENNLQAIKQTVGDIGFISKKYEICRGEVTVGVVYIDTIINTEELTRQIILPILRIESNNIALRKLPEKILKQHLLSPDAYITSSMLDIESRILTGYVVIFFEGLNSALLIKVEKKLKQSIKGPENEIALYGSKESFTDDIEINCSMIIKRLPIQKLKFKSFTCGRYSKTRVKLVWIDGVVPARFVKEAEKRLNKIDTNILEGIGMLAEMIIDNPVTIFPLYSQTERVDKTIRNLSEGRFAILCDSSPYAFIAPFTFWDNFKSVDDYTHNTFFGSLIRIIRLVSFLLSTVISPVYLSFVTYNHIIVPQELAMNIALGRKGVPFPSVIELLLLTFIIGVIREAGLRMPGLSGYFVGALGAIIIGQAAVDAGYVSASLIIVIAISAISTLAISVTTLVNTLVNTSTLINYFYIIFAGILGMYGLNSAMLLLYWHMIKLKSFGVSYLYPVVPLEYEGMKDTVIRAPLKSFVKRLNYFRSCYYK